MTVKIYKFTNSEQEAHMMGDYVAVCWNMHKVKRTLRGPDDIVYMAEVWERTESSRAPYIDFIDVREDSDGTFYKDDDSPIHGGLDPKTAIKVAIELKEACDYILNRGWEAK